MLNNVGIKNDFVEIYLVHNNSLKNTKEYIVIGKMIENNYQFSCYYFSLKEVMLLE